LPKFIILTGGGYAQSWEIPNGVSVIGRDEDVGLCLPNVSVSRRHAQVALSWNTITETDEWGESTVTKAVVKVKDLESRNGITLNDHTVDATTMEPGDTLRVGKFQLALVLDTQTFHKGRAVKYMPAWTGEEPPEGSTFALNTGDVKRMVERQHIIDEARMVLATNKNRFWHPEQGKLTFGGSGMVHVEGLLARGVVADISWDGDAHLIAKQGMLTKLKINGSSVSSHKLRSGDNVEICGTRFVYRIPK
jgi:hypothetical protein